MMLGKDNLRIAWTSPVKMTRPGLRLACGNRNNQFQGGKNRTYTSLGYENEYSKGWLHCKFHMELPTHKAIHRDYA